MSKLIVVIMENQDYPFGECANTSLQNKKIFVRKKVSFHPFQRNNILLKTQKIKSFINPFIIKLEQLLQQDSSLHLLFQYVPIKVQTWISNINSQFIEAFKSQLFQLADYLAENSIVIDFKLKNIGMDQNYQPKYFIGLDYQINTTNGKDLLLQKYKAQIKEILDPYKNTQTSFSETKTKSLSSINAKSSKVINPECSFKEQGFTKTNIKSLRQTQFQRQQKDNFDGTSKHQKSLQTSSFQKTLGVDQYILKSTFDNDRKILPDNLPKNISAKIKIEQIGRKINDLKKMMKNIGKTPKMRIDDCLQSNQTKKSNEQRPRSSYQKGIKRAQNVFKKVQGDGDLGLEINDKKEFRQTRSESQYCGDIGKSIRGLNRENEKNMIVGRNENRTKNGVQVNRTGQQSYIYEFEKLLDDQMDIFTDDSNTQEEQNSENIGYQEKKSPRFGFLSIPVNKHNTKTETERYSFSYTNKRRKKSTQSLTSNTSEIQERVNSVIGASRKLINNFKKPKPSEILGVY